MIYNLGNVATSYYAEKIKVPVSVNKAVATGTAANTDYTFLYVLHKKHIMD